MKTCNYCTQHIDKQQETKRIGNTKVTYHKSCYEKYMKTLDELEALR